MHVHVHIHTHVQFIRLTNIIRYQGYFVLRTSSHYYDKFHDLHFSNLYMQTSNITPHFSVPVIDKCALSYELNTSQLINQSIQLHVITQYPTTVP